MVLPTCLDQKPRYISRSATSQQIWDGEFCRFDTDLKSMQPLLRPAAKSTANGIHFHHILWQILVHYSLLANVKPRASTS